MLVHLVFKNFCQNATFKIKAIVSPVLPLDPNYAFIDSKM